MKFSEKIVILRKKYGLSQTKFAQGIGVSRQAVYKWECGQSYPEVAKLLEIKLQYNISIDDLLDDTYDIPMPEKKRRKRISKQDVARIEEAVAQQIRTEEDPSVLTQEEPAPVQEAAPVQEEIPAPVKEEAPKAETPMEKPDFSKVQTKEEKVSLFDRLFGKK